MFKIVTTDRFKHRINLSIPSDNPDKPHTGQFIGTFKRLSKAQLEAINKRDDNDDEAVADAKKRDFLDDVLLEVEGVVDDAGNPISSADAVALVKSDLAISSQTVQQYIDASLGVGAKNSVKSRGR